jgi:hypothetical protein
VIKFSPEPIPRLHPDILLIICIIQYLQCITCHYLEPQNADCLPPSFKLKQVCREFLLEPLLFVQGDAVNIPLQLDSDSPRISEASGRCIILCIGERYLKLESHVSSHVLALADFNIFCARKILFIWPNCFSVSSNALRH